ncbi:16S rRNA processing protein RimM [Chthonomonas calidirosea]|uniref:ribosome maturation factor RimM n=1 Tax=Chthonomonas calidirosea TaxID=454171 RepID=UPI0006DD41F8|nr:ribosome maturation factor RimM [Chthonomonas calidirosea]CEK16169.1 16S rRNA processing protein RimM [Chthonomonas calidirosea]CEK16170.1 16S rRNA processing protein RimM [Chthonomonas calidirosea]
MSLEEWTLVIGEIVAPFGIRGEVKVRLETDFPDRFYSLKQVCVRLPSGAMRLMEIESVRLHGLHKGQILLRFRNVGTVEMAEALRGGVLRIRPEEAVPLPPNEFYIHELIGFDVVTHEGTFIGRLKEVLRYPAHDIYVVSRVGKNEVLLPAVHEIVRAIDPQAKRIEVQLLPGLLSPDESEV